MNCEKDNLGIKGRFKIITTDKFTGKILRETDWQDNLIMLGANTGKDLILDRLNGTNTYSLNITYADIGTGTNTPAASDTTLQTVVARAGKTLGSIASNILSLQFFFPDVSLANGTYRELATFVDGTASVSTGQIFNRALFAIAYVKASNEDTTIQVDFTIT